MPTPLNATQHYDGPPEEIFALFNDPDFIAGRLEDSGAPDAKVMTVDSTAEGVKIVTRQSIPAEDRRRGPAHGSDQATHREPKTRDARSADPAAGRRAGSAPSRHQAAGRGQRGFGGSKGGVRRFSPPAGAHAPRAGRA